MDTRNNMVFSFAHVYQQTFSFPPDVIKNILTNACYNGVKKLYYTCKHFPSKYRLYLVDSSYDSDIIFMNNTIRRYHSPFVKLYNSINKIWFGESIVITVGFPPRWIYFTKIEKCTIKLFKADTDLQWNDFKILAKEGTIQEIYLVKVLNSDGQRIPFEDIFAFIPKFLIVSVGHPNVTANTMEKICNLRKNSTKIEIFTLNKVDSLLNTEDFLEFIGKHGSERSVFTIKFSSAVPREQKDEFARKIKSGMQKLPYPQPHFFVH